MKKDVKDFLIVWNEIFVRYGYIFFNKFFWKYFEIKRWYKLK